jgi:protein SCO1/2
MAWAKLGYIAIGCVVIAAFAFSVLRPILVLPRIAPAPRFALVDQQGKWLLDTDMRGHIALYSFTYTHCADACPQTSPVLQAVQARLDAAEADSSSTALVTISFDPERDTPQLLQAYATQLGANPRRWRFATGTPADLKKVIGNGFKTYYARNSDATYTFDPVFVLVDGDGVIRAEYRTATPSVDQILRDIRLVAEEEQNSSGARRYAYEAAHLFLCYPR